MTTRAAAGPGLTAVNKTAGAASAALPKPARGPNLTPRRCVVLGPGVDTDRIARHAFGAPLRRYSPSEASMLQRDDPRFLDEIRKSLYTAVLSDVLDELGLRDQAMAPSIRPLDELAAGAKLADVFAKYRVL